MAAASIIKVTSANFTSSTTAASWVGLDVGAAHPDRVLFIFTCSTSAGSTYTLTGITANGSMATPVNGAAQKYVEAGAGSITDIWAIPFPTGTAADIAVTATANMVRGGVVVIAAIAPGGYAGDVSNAPDQSPIVFDGVAGRAGQFIAAVYTGSGATHMGAASGALVGGAAINAQATPSGLAAAGAGFDWTGATELLDQRIATTTGASRRLGSAIFLYDSAAPTPQISPGAASQVSRATMPVVAARSAVLPATARAAQLAAAVTLSARSTTSPRSAIHAVKAGPVALASRAGLLPAIAVQGIRSTSAALAVIAAVSIASASQPQRAEPVSLSAKFRAVVASAWHMARATFAAIVSGVRVAPDNALHGAAATQAALTINKPGYPVHFDTAPRSGFAIAPRNHCIVVAPRCHQLVVPHRNHRIGVEP